MHFSFNAKYAEQYGLKEAVILQNIIWWVLCNKHKNKNKKLGKHWTFNSARAMSISFPFFSEQQVARSLRKLEKMGAIQVGNFNRMRNDKTKWYTLTDHLMKEVLANKIYKSWKFGQSKLTNHYQMEYTNLNNNKETLKEETPF